VVAKWRVCIVYVDTQKPWGLNTHCLSQTRKMTSCLEVTQNYEAKRCFSKQVREITPQKPSTCTIAQFYVTQVTHKPTCVNFGELQHQGGGKNRIGKFLKTNLCIQSLLRRSCS